MSVLDRWLKQNQEVDVLNIDFDAGIELFDRTFNSVTKEQLPIVGYYLERLSYLLGEHTEEWWTDWERKTSSREVEIEADFFDCYLQKSVSFDADLFIEPLPSKEREYNQLTKPVKIPTVELEAIIDRSHAEDVPGWSKQIEDYLMLRGDKCTMAELIKDLPLTSGAIVCTLLLGSFQLKQQGDDFYSSDSIEVKLCQLQ